MTTQKPAIATTWCKDRFGEPFLVREAQPDDAANLLRMIRAVFNENLPGLITQAEEFTYTEESEREFLLSHQVSQTSAALIAVHPESNEVLGFLDGRVSSLWKLRHTWRFGMSIAKPWRARGVGRALLEQAIHYVTAHPELKKIALEVIEDNTAAIRLYERLGFEHEGRRLKHVRRKTAAGTIEYVDELMMYRWLG